MAEAISMSKHEEHWKPEGFRRFPLHRIQPVLRKFFKVFQVNVDRLQQHRRNLEKLNTIESTEDEDKECIYSLRSVEQLVVTLQQIKQTRSQVEPEDLEALDCQLVELLNGAVLITSQFLLLHCAEEKPENKLRSAMSLDESSDNASILLNRRLNDMTVCAICTEVYKDPRALPCLHTFCLDCLEQISKSKQSKSRKSYCPLCRKEFSSNGGLENLPRNFFVDQLLEMNKLTENTLTESTSFANDSCPMSLKKQKSVGDLEPDRKTIQNSWLALEMKLLEFNDLLQEIIHLIEIHSDGNQHSNLLTINEQSSSKLSKYKLLLLPVAGAVLGGAIGGPVGLVAGLKIGKVAAVGGGIIGLTGGTFWKSRKESEKSNSSIEDDTCSTKCNSESKSQEETRRNSESKSQDEARRNSESKSQDEARRNSESKSQDEARRNSESKSQDETRRNSESKSHGETKTNSEPKSLENVQENPS